MCAGAERDQDATVGIVAPAIRRIAVDLVDVHALERPRDECLPHAAVEFGEPGLCPDERPERARRGGDHGAFAGQLRDGGLVAQLAECGADACERSAERSRRAKSSFAGELSAESDADLVYALAARTLGQGIDG